MKKATKMIKSIILLSGGLDSVISLALFKEKYNITTAVTFNYGQKAVKREIETSKKIADFYNLEHIIIDLPWLNEISTSTLNQNKDIPTSNNIDEITKDSKSLIVPNRNALFINIAASIAEAKNFKYIIIGANEEESHNFKDNSKDFINAINLSLKNSTENEVQVLAPLIDSDKKQIVEAGIKENAPFNLIHSCYKNEDKHCGLCESCLRLKRALQLNDREDIIKELF